MVPKIIRATVDVIATMDTCVAADVGTIAMTGCGGYRVPIMVPRLVMKASPGPAKLLEGIFLFEMKTYLKP